MEDLKEYLILSVKKNLSKDEIEYLKNCDDTTCRDFIDEKIYDLNSKFHFDALNKIILDKYIDYYNKKLENYSAEEIVIELSKLKS
jgi:hypothetical protein